MTRLSIIFMLFATFALAQTKKVTTSEIQWWGYKVAKTESSSHTGTLNLKSGNVVMKGNKIVGGTFVMDMNSINATDLTGEYQQKLNGHLKNGDFFETDKFPTASYAITSVVKNKDKNYPFLVKGNLTVKGKTNAVHFPAKISMKDGVLTLASSKFSFDRQAFGISYKSTMKDVLVKDEIDMQINLSAK